MTYKQTEVRTGMAKIMGAFRSNAKSALSLLQKGFVLDTSFKALIANVLQINLNSAVIMKTSG